MPSVTQSQHQLPLPHMPAEDLKAYLTEIGTTPENLRKDTMALREWVNSQPHLPDVTADLDEWMELFLLVSKNSMEKAKTRLDNYFTSRTTLADWFVWPSPPEEPHFIDETEFIKIGWLPRVLPNGYILLMEQPVMPADGDWSRIDMKLHFKRMVMQCDAVLGLNQKYRGAVLLMDQKNINLSIVTTFLASIGYFRKTMACVQDSLPMRLHSVHLVNTIAPNMQKMILSAVTPLLKGKLAQRINIHENMESLHKFIPAQYLPKEFGGTCSDTVDDATATLTNFLVSKKDWFASRTWMKTNEDRRLEKKFIASDLGVEGSFRKLSVD